MMIGSSIVMGGAASNERALSVQVELDETKSSKREDSTICSCKEASSGGL